MKLGYMKLGAGLALSAVASFASLIPIDTVPSTGNGLGAVYTTVTFQNIGVETGCVGVSSTGATQTGATQCYGVTAPGGLTNEQTGAGNNVYSASVLNIAPTGTNTMGNLVLLFNGSEGGNLTDQPITLTALSLNLFSTTGTLLGSFSTVEPYNISAFTGTGNAGFGFQLDAAQAAQANAILGLNPTLLIGVSASASGAQGGLETVSISRIDGTQGGDDPGVPEPATFGLIGGGLIAVGMIYKRRKLA